MRIHAEFFALKSSARWIEQMLNSEHVSDGAFARVSFDCATQVLKATTCSATNALYLALLKRLRSGQAVPEALPAVLKRHGNVVRDAEGFVFTVWSLERLFQPGEERQMQAARAGKHWFAAAKPAYPLRTARMADSDLDGLKNALEQEQRACASPDSWEGSAEIALVMSLRCSGELQKAFQFLLEFVREHKVQLDLLTRGNILVNMFGEPCLCDPVCDVVETPAPAKLLNGTCVAAMVPTELTGFADLVFAPRSTLPLPEESLRDVERQLRQLGLCPVRLPWGSPEHRQFLAAAPCKKGLWQVPDAARHLRQDSYLQAFAA